MRPPTTLRRLPCFHREARISVRLDPKQTSLLLLRSRASPSRQRPVTYLVTAWSPRCLRKAAR
jgi:hypothetical protein